MADLEHISTIAQRLLEQYRQRYPDRYPELLRKRIEPLETTLDDREFLRRLGIRVK